MWLPGGSGKPMEVPSGKPWTPPPGFEPERAGGEEEADVEVLNERIVEAYVACDSHAKYYSYGSAYPQPSLTMKCFAHPPSILHQRDHWKEDLHLLLIGEAENCAQLSAHKLRIFQ
mgnify:CR=1 FL=1